MGRREVKEITLKEMLACATREAAMRRKVYPGRVLAKRMTEDEASREIACMDAIGALLWTLEYEERAAANAPAAEPSDDPTPDMFGEVGHE